MICVVGMDCCFKGYVDVKVDVVFIKSYGKGCIIEVLCNNI